MNRIGGIAIQISALAFVAIVLVTIGLLIGGYGLPTGLGALVGFIVGSLAGLVGVLWLSRGSGRTVSVGGLHWNSQSSRSVDPDLERMALMRELTEVAGVDLGRVRRIVPVTETTKAADLTLQLIDVELHDAGLTINFDVEIGIGTLHPPHMARLSMTDDAGTAYRTSVQGNGSGPSRMRLFGVAIPAVPPSARRLTVRLDEFLDPFPPGPEPVVGPWTFEVDLP